MIRMKLLAGVACLMLAGSASAVDFTAGPAAARDGGVVKITFTVDAPTDVEVAIVDAKGQVVRHLAAGALGDNPPPPLAKGLAQSLTWDGKNDAGRPADGGPFSTRVGLGSGGEFGGVIGWSGQNIDQPRAMIVGSDGTLYLLHGEKFYGHRQSALITAFGRDGRYLRQVYPGPGDLSPDRRTGWPWMKLPDGSEVPIIEHVLTRSLYPGAHFYTSDLAVTTDGKLVTVCGNFSTTGSLIKHSDVRGGRRLLVLNIDGSVPKNYLGALISDEQTGGQAFLATSPDGRFAYVSGIGAVNLWNKKVPKEIHNVVYRAALDGTSDRAEVFVGKLREAGGGKDRLNDPLGIAVDKAGRLYVADTGNQRIAVFAADGSFVREFPAPEGVTRLAVAGNGAVYTRIDNKLVRLAQAEGKAPGVEAEVAFPPVGDPKRNTFEWAMDDSGERPAFYLSTGWWIKYALARVEDRGDRFESLGDTIAAHHSDADPGLPFIINVAVAGDRLVTRTPSFPAGNRASLAFNALTGQYEGTWIPKTASGADENINALMFCGGEITGGKDGRFYSQTGGFMWPEKNQANAGTVRRYDVDGKPVPFPALGQHFIHKYYHGHHRPAGMFVTRDGTIYLAAFPGYRGRDQEEKGLHVYVIGPDGKEINDRLIHVAGATVGGIAVDPAGNVYLGVQIWPKGERIPSWLAGGLPQASAHGHPTRAYQQHGALVKFGPEGGSIAPSDDGQWMGHAGGYAQVGTGNKPIPLKVEGAKWVRRVGFITINDLDEAGCQCENTRFDVDDFGRVYIPDLYRFRIAVLDSAGNELTHFGQYGNMDAPRGGGSTIPLGWPIAVELAHGRAYVADLNNRRIVVAKLTHAVERTVELK